MHWNGLLLVCLVFFFPFFVLFCLLQTGRAASASFFCYIFFFSTSSDFVSVFTAKDKPCSLDFSLTPLVSLTLLVHSTRDVGFCCFMASSCCLSDNKLPDVPAVPGSWTLHMLLMCLPKAEKQDVSSPPDLTQILR